ncbi:SMP-30/gluconolactonase/LRE family protein [Polyangium aurulentum]|uniref:SMP-30/gluconolactonase/LRE family protein n=1 Tax=Polyangium aurulentum TaxID=2567896 RepID=UPI0010AE2BFD|nr:SMP-30/gluconolactonase/LRE family protein [Polyangium aurulentum]UQA60486.1 SMP-30/gluconolactonase/LRE family protein [Polyangium aurulentum]
MRSAAAVGEVTTLKSFDFNARETPENIVVLTNGTICTTLLMAGAVWRSTDGAEQVVREHDDALAVGLASDADDRLYVAVRSRDANVAGIWRRDAAGRWARFAAAEARAGLNGITFDESGTLFAADSVNGEILYLPPGQRELQRWLDDDLLKPTAPDDPVSSTGVNGLKFWDGGLYVTNTAQATVLRIDIQAGQPDKVTRVYSDIPADDFAFDVSGNMYLAVHPENTVQRIAPNGDVTVLATADDGLDGPTAIVVVREGLLVTNLGILGTRHTPSLLRLSMRVDAPALPRPKLAP